MRQYTIMCGTQFHSWNSLEKCIPVVLRTHMQNTWNFLQAIRSFETNHPEHRTFPNFQFGGSMSSFCIRWIDSSANVERKIFSLQLCMEGNQTLTVYLRIYGESVSPEIFMRWNLTDEALTNCAHKNLPVDFCDQIKQVFHYKTCSELIKASTMQQLFFVDALPLLTYTPQRSVKLLNVPTLTSKSTEKGQVLQ